MDPEEQSPHAQVCMWTGEVSAFLGLVPDDKTGLNEAKVRDVSPSPVVRTLAMPASLN